MATTLGQLGQLRNHRYVPGQQRGAMPGAGGAAPGGVDHGANFSRLYQQDPRLAYGYTNADPSASQWYQQNQNNILRDQFRGNETDRNQWVNAWGGGNNTLSDQDRMMLGGMAGAPGATPQGGGAGASIGGSRDPWATLRQAMSQPNRDDAWYGGGMGDAQIGGPGSVQFDNWGGGGNAWTRNPGWGGYGSNAGQVDNASRIDRGDTGRDVGMNQGGRGYDYGSRMDGNRGMPGAPAAAPGWLGSMGGGYQKGVSGGVDPNNPLGVTGNMAQQQQTGGAEPNPYVPNVTGLPQSPTTMPGMGEAGGGGAQSQTPAQSIGGGGDFQPVQATDLDVNKFLDPSMNFRIQQGTNALESSAAARGGLLSGATLKGVQDYSQNIASQEYSNAINRAMQDRGYRTDTARDSRNFNYGVNRDDRDFGYRAGVDDRDFNESSRRYDQGFDYNARRDDRDFNYRRDVGDRQFGYDAARGDRDFNYQRERDLTGWGMQGADRQAMLQQELARLLNSNIIGGGNAGGAGAIGGANAMNDMITQLLKQLSQGQWMGGG